MCVRIEDDGAATVVTMAWTSRRNALSAGEGAAMFGPARDSG